ncbi:calcium permeable stress-gated cation channel 1 isoform X1 [Crotalus tigris]|uniref:calcium permeable stress-gated cation channel 1 isoform X1 n=1 Tax=Crotalus tigris TaxID=88082 RepID=UPI00192FA6BE|nr:calcium permeable stress-gated cation channel 1 isoform X1 [Crotalus tigris]XP_039207569.1 calcium permeable stress-gated cation channel 1 isoform X1 [Crotalus tigris]XP_039207571.1 calcium permeable stress-gated cation channel 1 isoform X1 [Crotalus tigris]XP_039207572.1 calcium permeable stress-gated cation channel 1 isoform X1 [Crotalus tigris]XP_039207573.1 calcium permeable stress-gated cation channel 1 isoform X1 [Crotalus tigris]XP_039207574.1 calcium permeable stress-gated cation ch
MDNMIATTSSSEDTNSVSLNVLTYLDTLTNSTEDQCFSARSHSTVLQGLPFGGVPTVLALNFLLWMVLLFIFSCLRKAAWDYGRLALLMDNDSRLPPSTWNSYDLTSLFYGEQSEKEKSPSESSPLDADNKDVGFCSWLLSIYQMKDEEIQSKCGVDATTYLSFQRHLLVLLLIACVLSVAVILPVNFSGDLLGKNPANFGRTTIANVPKDDRLLWLHSIFALLYFIITVLCMTHHSIQLEYKENEKLARTLMVTRIPKEITDTSLVVKHFHEAYPSCTVTGVQFCSDVRRLMKLDSERRKAMKGRLYFTTKAQKEGKIMIKIHPCSRIFCCRICGFEEVDAEQYYGELEEKLTDEFNAERSRIALKRLDMAFVTFQDERMTATILKDYSRILCRKHPQQSSVTTVVKSHCWGVSYAPAPNDIIWENLSVGGALWWVKFVLLNICLFLLLFFLTTPAIIVNTMDMFNVTRPVESLKNPIVTQFFPTLLLWAFSVFLPFIVYYSAFFETHWTRSSENQITMHKCYFFLVFMVIILPSLGLTSLDLFFRWLFDTHFVDQAEIKFQCVFLPDNGAFFVNYVITSSLIGTAMELLRIPGLIVYATRLCFAKSEPERLHIKRNQAYEFQFGLEYAWTCCIFAVVMTYSITCPIIVPFGLLYMLLKHMVDCYNIYYVYIPTRLNHRIHSAAVNQVVTAPILCMFWLLFFSILRLGSVRPITIFTCVVLLCCSPFSFFGLCLKKFHPRKPSSYQMSEQSDGAFNDTETSSISSTPNSNMFVATVLQEPELSLTPAASPAHQSYGTMGGRLEQAENIEEGGLPSFETELENTEGKYRTGPMLDTETHYH